jgi:seryl-tRNA synthetase
MLDRRFLRDSQAAAREGLAKKHAAERLDEFLRLDAKQRERLAEVEGWRARRNEASEAIGRAKREGQDASAAIAAMKELGERLKAGEVELAAIETELERLLHWFPNLPDADVPVGDESQNQIVRSWGEVQPRTFPVLPHWELAERLGILHLAKAAAMSGSGFGLLTGAGARLERALVQWFLDVHTSEHGYVEMNAPYLVRDEAMFGTGQLPKLADDMYRTTEDGLWLIPTAEVSVTNFYRQCILEPDELPARYVAFSPCFRREAGSAGKDTRGILRVHQFHKVEMVRFTTPERSEVELEELVGNAETLLQRLKLPYRVVKLASGDLSFAAAKCYDLEVYSAGVDKWLEVSSCSNFRDFQARRAEIRYRPQAKAKPRFVHTLSGSGLALPRILVAILENHQDANGRVRLPQPLRPYLSGAEYLDQAG